MTPGLERPRLALLLTLATLSGCGEGNAPKERRFSTPVTQPAQPLTLGEGPVPEPIRAERLGQLVPEITALPPLGQASVEGVLNTHSAPCLPCEDDGSSFAACLDREPPGCENLPVLARRAARLAQAGASPGAIRATITYPEPWSPLPHLPDLPTTAPSKGTPVELWVDPGFGPWVQAVQRADELVVLGEAEAVVGPVSLRLRVLPSGSEAQQPARIAARQALAAADGLGAGLAYARCLAQAAPAIDEAALLAAAGCSGVDAGAWQQARSSTAQARVEQDIQDAQSIGLRAAPSWRVDGYRLRGHRELVSVRDAVENQHIDQRSELPTELLQPWDPGLTPAAPEGTPTP